MKSQRVEILATAVIKILSSASKRTPGSNWVTPKGEFTGLFS